MDATFKADMKELHRRLRKAMLAGVLNKWSYDVGMHLLHCMLRTKGTNFTFTWAMMERAVLLDGETVLADPAPSDQFFFYDALQQLEAKIGIATDVDPHRMFERIVEGRAAGRLYNFTGLVDEPAYVVMPETVVYCTYEPWVSAGLDDDILENVAGMGSINYLPKWVCSGVR